MSALFWIAVAFAGGAIPFAVWLGRAVTGRDVRAAGGDGNPGAANAWRAGGWRLGVLVLDFLKGALPVAAAHWGAHLTGPALAAVAVAPVAGHAFSPFLSGQGGKGLTVTFGVLAGLSLGHSPLVLGLFTVVLYTALRADAWAVLLSLLGLLAHMLLSFPDPAWIMAWAGIALIVIVRHRQELGPGPRLRLALVHAVGGWVPAGKHHRERRARESGPVERTPPRSAD